jgi:RNA polymerase sigma-70 factor (ECF subfamily)
VDFKNEQAQKEYFEILVKEHGPALYKHIISIVRNHDDADDILQNVFVKVWTHLHQFREEAHIQTWLYRITHNETLGFLRRLRLRKFFPLTTGSHKSTQTDFFAGYGEAERLFYEAIDMLPPRQKMVFHYKYFQKLSYEEMARITGITEGALKASYHHAVKKIEEALKHCV